MSDDTNPPAPPPPGDSSGAPAGEGPWSSVSERWEQVGAQFRDLGRNLSADATEAVTDERLESERRAVDQALRDTAEAVSRVVASLGDSIRDAEVRDGLSKAGNTLAEAVTATVETAVDEVRRAFRIRKPGDGV